MHTTHIAAAIIAILCIAAGLWFRHQRKNPQKHQDDDASTMEECGWDVASSQSPYYSAEKIAEINEDIKNRWNGPGNV